MAKPGCQTQPQHYSLSFRSKADRLVVNKPSNTTHEGVGPGCYDLSKDGKSVGVKTEKRVGRRGSEGRGPTNQYLVDWRAYMKRPPTANDGYGGSGGVGDGGRGSPRGKAEPSPQSAPHGPPETPKTVSYALTRQSESWAAARNWPRVAAAGRAGKEEVETGGSRETGQRSHQEARSRQHRHSEQEMETFFPQEQGRGQGQPQQQQQQRPQQQQQQQHKAGDLMRRAKRPASAVASVRIPSATAAETHALPRRRYGLPRRGRNSNGKISSGRGGGAGGSSRSVTSAIFSETGSCSAVSTSTASGFGPPQFVPRPPSVDTACRPRATGSARVERVSSQYADTCVDSDRGCNNGRSGGGGGGDNGVGAVRMGDTSDKSIFKGEVVAASTSSSPIEVVNGTNRRPPTLEPVGKEKPAGGGHLGGIGVGSGRVGGGIEVNPPRGASRPAHSLYAEVPPGTNRAASAGETRGPREEDGGDIVGTNRTRVIVAEAAAGRNGGASTAAVTTARPGCTTNHSFDGEVSRTSDSNAYRPSPSNSTTAVVEHKSPRHRQEPALRTSSMAFGATGGELCGELAPEREGSRAARLTAIAVTDAIIGGAVATAIAAQPGVADFGRWL